MTIEEFEKDIWPSPSSNASRLILKCHELRRKEIEKLEIEELRLLISQNIGLKVLLPHAVVLLKQNPFIEGDFYEGDLLKSVLYTDKGIWEKLPSLKIEVANICSDFFSKLDDISLSEEIINKIRVGCERLNS